MDNQTAPVQANSVQTNPTQETPIVKDTPRYAKTLALLALAVNADIDISQYANLIDPKLQAVGSVIINSHKSKTPLNLDELNQTYEINLSPAIANPELLGKITQDLETEFYYNRLGELSIDFSKDPKKEFERVQEVINKQEKTAVQMETVNLRDTDAVNKLLEYEDPPRQSTGILAVDALWWTEDNPECGYFSEEEFLIIQGRTGDGKTFLLMKMIQAAIRSAQQRALDKRNVAVMSPELSIRRMALRILTQEKEARFNIGDDNPFEDPTGEMGDIFVSFLEHGTSVETVEQFCLDNNIGVLFIDGIYLMVKDQKDWGEQRELGIKLKQLCTKHHLALIGVMQENRSQSDVKSGRQSGGDGIATQMTSCLAVSAVSTNPDGSKAIRIYGDKLREAGDRIAVYLTWRYRGNTYEFQQAVYVNGSAEDEIPNYIQRFPATEDDI